MPTMSQTNALALRQRISTTSGSLHNSDISSQITGKEVLGDHGFLFEDSIALWSSVSQDSLPIRNRVWGDLSNRQLPHELPELIVRRLEKADGAKIPRIQRSYVNGLLYKDVLEWAITLSVGITFLPGADVPQVARLEQSYGEELDLKSALWKVNTAGLLLADFDVGRDLSVTRRDQSLVIATKARSRRAAKSDSAPLAPSQMGPLMIQNHDAAVTIDSDIVCMVQGLKARRPEWDVEATLIEVDGSSMMDLMIHYRQLVQRAGPDMNFQVRKQLLEIMIEDARRLVLRSPILFRMSTRVQIIASKNTRYGVDSDRYFQTLATSKGIKEAIRLSAAYFDSLKPIGIRDDTQAFLRPKFLQMIVLLLSLLNDDDLKDISTFLETTYHLKADRKHLEILFLKVIPLTSINSTVFLKTMTAVYQTGTLDSKTTFDSHDQMSRTWDHFLKAAATDGFLLPGNLGSFAGRHHSWIFSWPASGIDTATVFRHLQYSGSEHRAFNEVQPLELYPESDAAELAVLMSNNQTYNIASSDLAPLTCMASGRYAIRDSEGKTHELLIKEFLVNDSLRQAVDLYNSVVSRYNRWALFDSSSEKKWSLPSRSRRGAKRLLDEYRDTCGPLTRTRAILDGVDICTCFKVEGRKIPLKDAAQTMKWPANDMENICDFFDRELSTVNDRRLSGEKDLIRKDLQTLRVKLKTVRQEALKWMEEGQGTINPDEPIAKVLYPGGVDPREPVWFDYEAVPESTKLRITGLRSKVNAVEAVSDELLKVTFQADTERWQIYVTTIEASKNPEVLRESVIVNDVAVLAGQYMVIGTETCEPSQFHLACYLRIKTVERPKLSIRQTIYRIAEKPQPSPTVFC